MKGKSISLLLLYLTIIGKVIYNLFYFVYRPEIPLTSLISSYIILTLAISYVYVDSKKKLKAVQFLPFFACEFIVVLVNIILNIQSGKMSFTILEQGIIGGGLDLVINLGLIIYILVANRDDIKNSTKNI